MISAWYTFDSNSGLRNDLSPADNNLERKYRISFENLCSLSLSIINALIIEFS